MTVIVDGYNVIKQVLGCSRVSHAQRDQFVNELISYLRKKQLDGVIVFDGGSFSYPHTIVHGKARIIFSGYKEKADAIIMRFIDEHANEELLIVSSDREIRTHAHNKQKTSVPADEFYYRYVTKKEPSAQYATTPLYKQALDAPQELDELMRQASEEIQIKEDDLRADTSGKNRPAHKESKHERKQQRSLRKL